MFCGSKKRGQIEENLLFASCALSSVEQKQTLLDNKRGSVSNKGSVKIRFRQIKASKIQASIGNISYNENVGLFLMILPQFTNRYTLQIAFCH